MASVPPKFVRAIIGDLAKVAKKRPDLTNVSSIQIHMCPWDKRSLSTKVFWSKISGERSRKTNRSCSITTSLAHNRSEPTIIVQFYDEEKLCIHSQNMLAEEIFYHFNAFCINNAAGKKDIPSTLF